MSVTRMLAWSVVVVVAIAALCSIPVSAAEKDAKVAIVDTQKLLDAPRIKRLTQELQNLGKTYDAKLQALQQSMLLSPEETKELLDLKFKDPPVAADTARIKVLEDKQKALDAEYSKLQQGELTDAQKARRKELQDVFDKSKAAGNQTVTDYNVILQNKQKEVDGKVETEILQAIKTYAQAKGYTLVYNKAVVLYGGTDITDDLIKKLD